jgi:hypothetical protein
VRNTSSLERMKLQIFRLEDVDFRLPYSSLGDQRHLTRCTMLSSIEATPNRNAGLAPRRSRYVRWMPAPRKFGAYAMTVIDKLRDLAPYAAIELVLPGGSLMALLLWIYRRQRKVSGPSMAVARRPCEHGSGDEGPRSVRRRLRIAPWVRAIAIHQRP